MKKHNLFIATGVVAAALAAGSANAAPANHGGNHHTQPNHTVVHVQSAPRPGHHSNRHHDNHHHQVTHHHHHHDTAGNIILATAILISAMMQYSGCFGLVCTGACARVFYLQEKTFVFYTILVQYCNVVGAQLSLVEYLHGVQGVAGSIPVAPTIKFKSTMCRF